jgi:hypothetical protein
MISPPKLMGPPMPFRRAFAALGLITLALLLVAPSAQAETAGAPAYLRLAHLSPDTPPVDVHVLAVADPTQSFVLPGVGYGAVSEYRPVPAGSYVISMRLEGADPGSPPVISTTLDATPGSAHTVAGTGLSAELGLTVLPDQLDIPPAGRASVRVINAAVSAPVVDCGPSGEVPWARDVRFGTSTSYADVPLGVWNLTVTSDSGPVATLPVTLDSNSVYSVLLVDRDGEVAAELYRDSSGSALVPTGGVETGLGGTAGPGPVVALGLLVAVAVLVGTGVSRVTRAH